MLPESLSRSAGFSRARLRHHAGLHESSVYRDARRIFRYPVHSEPFRRDSSNTGRSYQGSRAGRGYYRSEAPKRWHYTQTPKGVFYELQKLYYECAHAAYAAPMAALMA